MLDPWKPNWRTSIGHGSLSRRQGRVTQNMKLFLQNFVYNIIGRGLPSCEICRPEQELRDHPRLTPALPQPEMLSRTGLYRLGVRRYLGEAILSPYARYVSRKVVRPFLLADIGEGITECEVIKW